MAKLHRLALEVLPSPGTNDHEVRVLVDGDDFLATEFAAIGLDPDDFFRGHGALRADATPRDATIGRCDCGTLGCGDAQIRIVRRGDRVRWCALDAAPDEDHSAIDFDAAAYHAELARAAADTSWETPDRVAARLVRESAPTALLRKHGLSLEWVSSRVRPCTLTVSMHLEPGPYQVLLHVPWPAGISHEQVARTTLQRLADEPQSWRPVDFHRKTQRVEGRPGIAGPGWCG